MRFIALAPLQFKNLEVKAGETFTLKSEDAIGYLVSRGVVKSLKDVLTEQYQKHLKWLASQPVTAIEIQRYAPELLKVIHEAIKEMDNHFLNENLQGFNEARNRVEALYLKAKEASNGCK